MVKKKLICKFRRRIIYAWKEIPTLEKMTGNVAGELKFGLWQNVFGLMGKNCFRKLSASSGLDP